MTTTRLIALLLLPALAALSACETNPRVSRAEPSSVLDYQTGFDEDDAREISLALVADAVEHPWIDRWEARHDRAPVLRLRVGDVPGPLLPGGTGRGGLIGRRNSRSNTQE